MWSTLVWDRYHNGRCPLSVAVCEQLAEIIELCVARSSISAHRSCETRYQNGKCPFLYDLCATWEIIELCAAETKKCSFLYDLRATGPSRSIETLCGRKPQCVARNLPSLVHPLGARTRVLRTKHSQPFWKAKERLRNTLTLNFSPSR